MHIAGRTRSLGQEFRDNPRLGISDDVWSFVRAVSRVYVKRKNAALAVGSVFQVEKGRHEDVSPGTSAPLWHGVEG